MKKVILRPNGASVYSFLSLMNARLSDNDQLQKKKILDCGAGGPVPPLELFQQQGLEIWGIDTSKEQLEKAHQFCDKQGIELDLREGDMRQIPFEDGFFDYVYEHYSMCHLSKVNTAQAVSEMHRVLKIGGFCFLGFKSNETWPRSLFGEEEGPGEYWGEEGGKKRTLHSLFTDQETDELETDWEIVQKRKEVQYLQETAEETSLSEWMELYGEADNGSSREDWGTKYERRADIFCYVHTYYYLKKS
ncbi:MAG: class I SAM-dependent methyltransferase [Anaerolineales bacterium]